MAAGPGETPGEYLVCFSEKCHKEDVKQYIIECISAAKFSVSREEFEGKTLLTIGAPFEVLAQKVRSFSSIKLMLYKGAFLRISSSFCFANGREVIVTKDLVLGGGS